MSWINEVDVAGSFDDLVTSQSIKGDSFLDLEMLDARIASAFRKIISSTSFRKRVIFEGQRAQKYNRFLRGQIAYTIYGHFQSTAAHDAAQGLSDCSNICLQNDDVQDFDTRWIRSCQEQVRCVRGMFSKVSTKTNCKVLNNFKQYLL